MVFRACLGSSLGLIIGLTISFFMVEVVNGKHVKNPLQRMQLKQKQRNNMILKRYKSQKSFLVPKCFIFWKFESFSKKASISRFPTWIFWKNHRETTSRKSEGETASTKCPCFTHRSCMKAVPKILHFLWFCSPSSPKKLKPMNSKGSKDQVKLKGLKSIPQQFSIRSPEKLKLATGKSHWYICIYYIIYIYTYTYILFSYVQFLNCGDLILIFTTNGFIVGFLNTEVQSLNMWWNVSWTLQPWIQPIRRPKMMGFSDGKGGTPGGPLIINP